MAKVAIAVPTFRRPKGLERLLAALAHLETSADVEIVVADNDAAMQEGADTCRRIAGRISLAAHRHRRLRTWHRAGAQRARRTCAGAFARGVHRHARRRRVAEPGLARGVPAGTARDRGRCAAGHDPARIRNRAGCMGCEAAGHRAGACTFGSHPDDRSAPATC